MFHSDVDGAEHQTAEHFRMPSDFDMPAGIVVKSPNFTSRLGKRSRSMIFFDGSLVALEHKMNFSPHSSKS